MIAKDERHPRNRKSTASVVQMPIELKSPLCDLVGVTKIRCDDITNLHGRDEDIHLNEY